MEWAIDTYSKKFNHPWKISGVEVEKKDIIIVTFSKGDFSGVGEVAYGSKDAVDLEKLKDDLEFFVSEFKNQQIFQFNEFTTFLDTQYFSYNGLRFAIEAAFLDYLHNATEITPWRILGTNMVKSVDSIYSLPLFKEESELTPFEKEMNDCAVVKFKICKDYLDEQISYINSHDKKFILDANESWGRDYKGFLEDISKVDKEKILFIEQPLSRDCVDEYIELKKQSDIDIFLDESLQDHKHLSAFCELCDGVVVKGTKAGSLMRVVTQMTQAKKLGLKSMLGCMVESSVGISALFSICYGFDYYDFDGFLKLESDQKPRVFWDNGKVVLSTMN